MFAKNSSKAPMACGVCKALSLVYLILGVLVTIAAIIGAFMAIFPADQKGMVFGSISGSLALMTLVVSLFFMKKMGSCCPCQCAMPTKK